MNELALFMGAGGGLLASRLLGWRTVCGVEINKFCIERVMQRQNEGHLEPFPIWDDIRTFDGRPWRKVVDVVSGGFPCQDISCAGSGAGIDGERSGLWGEMARIINEIMPKFVFVENSPLLIRRGATRVLRDLAKMGYDAKWGCMGGDYVGALVESKRFWLVAFKAHCSMLESNDIFKNIIIGKEESFRWQHSRAVRAAIRQDDYTEIKRNFNVVAEWMDRLKAIGNGQIPAVAKLAWEILK